MNRPQSVAERIDARLGTKGQKWKHEFLAMVGEFVGTTMFLLLSFGGTHIANLPGATVNAQCGTKFIDTPNLMFISISFGFSLMINVWIFFRVSGALFNPAVSLALALAKVITPLRGVLMFVAQLLGGIAAAALIDGLMPGPLNVGTKLSGGISIAQGLFLEMFLTAQLVLVVFMLAVEKHKSTFLAPVGIGLALFAAEIAGVYYTGGSLNPARSFGPDFVLRSFPGYHWIYWIGPGLGAILSTGLYTMMKVLDYDKVNGTQDRDDTILVAQIIPRVSNNSSQQTDVNNETVTLAGNGMQGEIF